MIKWNDCKKQKLFLFLEPGFFFLEPEIVSGQKGARFHFLKKQKQFLFFRNRNKFFLETETIARNMQQNQQEKHALFLIFVF